MTPLVLLGAGDHAREIAEIAVACAAGGNTAYELAGYLVEPAYGRPGTSIDGVPILGDPSWLHGRAGSVHTLCAVGLPRCACDSAGSATATAYGRRRSCTRASSWVRGSCWARAW